MNEILINLIGVFVTLVIVPLIGFLGYAIHRFIQEKVKSEKLKSGLSTVLDIIEKSAIQAAAIYEEELRKNGEITAESQTNALNKAIINVKELVSEDMKKLIEIYHIDFENWLKTQINAYLKK